MSYSKLVNVLDLEMELSRPQGSQIIEIGLTVVDAEKRQIVQSYSFPIKYPTQVPWPFNDVGYIEVPDANKVTPEITALTGWTEKKLIRQGEPLAKVTERLATKYGAKNRLCVIDSEDEFEPFKYPLGTMNPFGGKTFNISEMFRLKTRTFTGVSLLDMLKGCGLEFEGRQHSGKDDSYNIARVFLVLTN